MKKIVTFIGALMFISTVLFSGMAFADGAKADNAKDGKQVSEESKQEGADKAADAKADKKGEEGKPEKEAK